MSEAVADDDEQLICDYCGGVIEEPLQQCPALHSGVCEP